MNSIIRFHFGAFAVHVIIQANEYWFFLEDVRSAVGIEEGQSISDALDESEMTIATVNGPGGVQEVVVVSLSGLFAVAGASKESVAREFRRWVTGGVLPSIASGGSATVLPPRPRDDLRSTSEIAESLGVHATTLGKRVKDLKTEQHGEWHRAVGRTIESPIDRWWWNPAGTAAVLQFARSAARSD